MFKSPLCFCRALCSAVFICVGVMLSCTSWSVEFSVTTLEDAIDVDVTDNVCLTAAGECSLRAAVQQANALPGLDHINLPSGEYFLGGSDPGENEALSGDLDISDSLSIRGEEVELVTISAGRVDRIFDLRGSVQNPTLVSLSRMTVRLGIPPDSERGGCIRNEGAELIVDEVRFQTCHALEGGAIYQSSDNPQRMQLTNVSFDDTEAGRGGSLYSSGVLNIDGGVFVRGTAYSSHGSAIYATGLFSSVSNSQFIQNQSGQDGTLYFQGSETLQTEVSLDRLWFDRSSGSGVGGAIVFQALEGGLVASIHDSEFIGGLSGDHFNARQGGVISSRGADVTIRHSRFLQTRVTGEGGAIQAHGGKLSIFDSEFIGNEANQGGAIAVLDSEIMIERTEFTENQAEDFGGAIAIEGESLAFFAQNSIFNNAALADLSRGGGIYTTAPMRLENSSFFENQAHQGGALFLSTTADSELVHVSFDNNEAVQGSQLFNDHAPLLVGLSFFHDGQGVQCIGPIHASAVNFSTDESCHAIVTSAADLAVVDERYDNVIAIDGNSVMIDAASGEDNQLCLPNDQRGMLRSDGLCDIGAFERDASRPSAGAIQFVDAAMVLFEPAVDGRLTIALERVGGSNGAVSARVVLNENSGTAIFGEDFDWHDQVVSWPDGDASVKLVTLTVLADEGFDGSRDLQLDIAAVTGFGATGQNQSILIDLQDLETSIIDPTPEPSSPPGISNPSPSQPPVTQIIQSGGGGSVSLWMLVTLLLLTSVSHCIVNLKQRTLSQYVNKNTVRQ